MSISVQESNTFDFAAIAPAMLLTETPTYREVYEQNHQRIYCLSFWMTDNELSAEQLMTDTFLRAFATSYEPSADDVDRALIAELREYMPLGSLSLNCQPCDQVLSVRSNTLRVDLERAVVQLPSTEKMIFLMHDVERYDHARIASLLNITEDQSYQGVHQARLRMRELLAK